MQLCPNCGEENPDRFRLCGFCGTSLAAEQPPPETRKTVSIVFCDLKGSTDLGERLDTETLREVLSHYFGRMRRVLEQHGGVVEKYIGDAIMAVFGLPRAHEDDAFRAVRAAHEMRLILAQVNDEIEGKWGVRIANRTGVNTGEVIGGDISTGQRLVTGDTVNVAARLEQAAPENEVLIGLSTYRLVRDGVEVEELEPLELKGKAERVPAFRLLSVSAPDQAITRRLDSPMVGRAEELRRLDDRWDRARRERRCHMVTIVADAGTGKSRLILQFAQHAEQQGTVIRARCLSYGEGITFLPLAEVIRVVTSIQSEDPPDVARAKLAALVDGEVYSRLAAVAGLAIETYPIEETFWAARKLFEQAARLRPMVVVFDDIHWAEPTFLDLIERLAADIDDAPVLILCSARYDLLESRPDWATGGPGAERIELHPLSPEDSALVVQNLLGDAPVPPEVRERIVQASEGNPLFVEQMLSMLIDRGILAKDAEGGWIVTGDGGAISIPPSISALLAARLDTLAGEERALVERGSVVGSTFYRGAVMALSPEDHHPVIGSSLSSLTRKQMIRPQESDLAGQEAHRFSHALIRDAAYDGLLKRLRIEFHEAVAEWLESAATNLVEFEEIIGYHLEHAYRYRTELGTVDEAATEVGRRAAQRLASAGRRAFAGGDMPAAANLMDRASSVLAQDDPLRIRVLPDLGEALDAQGDFARAEAVLTEAIEAAIRIGDRSLEMEAIVVRTLIRNSTDPKGRGTESLAQAERATPILEAAGNYQGLARAWRLVAFVHGTAGRYGAAQEALDRLIENARQAGDRRLESQSLPNYGWCAVYGPMPVPDAIRHCEQLLDQATGDRRSESLLRCALAQLVAMEGRFDEARGLVSEARAMLRDRGERVLASSRSLDVARIELLADDPPAAERELRSDYEALDAMGERYFLPGVAGLLAYALCLQDRLEEAERMIQVSEAWAEEDAEDQALWRRARAKVLARWGRRAEAEALLREALVLVEATDSPLLQANTLMDLGDVLRLSGRAEEGRPSVQTALDLFERKGHIVAARRARSMLEGLAVSPGEGLQPPAPS